MGQAYNSSVLSWTVVSGCAGTDFKVVDSMPNLVKQGLSSSSSDTPFDGVVSRMGDSRVSSFKLNVSDAICFSDTSGSGECSRFTFLTDKPAIIHKTTVTIRRNNTPATTMYTVVLVLPSLAVGALSGNKVVVAIVFVNIISEFEELPVTVTVLSLTDNCNVPGTVLLNLSKIRDNQIGIKHYAIGS